MNHGGIIINLNVERAAEKVVILMAIVVMTIPTPLIMEKTVATLTKNR